MDNNEVTIGLGNVATDTYSYINNLISNPVVILIIVIVLIIYIMLFATLGSEQVNASESDSSSSLNWVVIFVVVLLLLIIGNGLIQYIFSVDIFASIKNLFQPNAQLDIVIDQRNISTVPEITLYPQVFNIPENAYGYEDAKALCKAYNARLATYQELESTYNKGGEWCNYGWSEGQMALFPTQQKTWDKLQTIKGHENDCGRPGVNGGYIDNPHIKFGVNCYGHKPKMTEEEEELMATQPIYPKTMKDILMEKRVAYWKERLPEINVSPFNHNQWSKL